MSRRSQALGMGREGVTQTSKSRSKESRLLREEMLLMEKRLVMLRKNATQSRKEYELKTQKNKGFYWAGARTTSIRTFAEEELKRVRTKQALKRAQQEQKRRTKGNRSIRGLQSLDLSRMTLSESSKETSSSRSALSNAAETASDRKALARRLSPLPGRLHPPQTEETEANILRELCVKSTRKLPGERRDLYLGSRLVDGKAEGSIQDNAFVRTTDTKPESQLTQGSFDEERSRQSFLEARKQWLESRGEENTKAKQNESEGKYVIAESQVHAEESSNVTRISCYHCYALVFEETSFKDESLLKNFCSEDCSLEFSAVCKIACSRLTCYKSFFRRDAEKLGHKLFCSLNCIELYQENKSS